MRSLIKQLSYNLASRMSLQILLLLSLICIGLFTALTYQNFLYLQAQNISRLSVYNEVIKPLTGLVLLFQLLIVVLSSSQLIPYFRSRGQVGILLHSCLSNLRLAVCFLLTVLLFSIVPLLYFLLISFYYLSVSSIDWTLILTSSIAMLSGVILFAPLAIAMTSIFNKALIASLLSLTVIVCIIILDEVIRTSSSFSSLGIFLDLLMQLRDGVISYSSIFNWLLWTIIATATMFYSIQRLRFQPVKIAISIIGAAVCIIILKSSFLLNIHMQTVDITEQNLNSLSQAEIKILGSIKGKITFTAVIDDVKEHDEIRQAFNVLKEHHRDIELNFSNRQALGQKGGFVDEFVTVEIAGQKQSIRHPFDRSAKEALAQMVIQLQTRSNQWITFIEGHGEATPFEKTNRGLSSYYESLKQLGWPVAMQNLSKSPIISQNTKVLVIADSRQEWLASEVNAVLEYLNKGGNLLLLREKDDVIPNDFSQFIGISPLAGTLVDWQGYQSGTPHPAVLIVNQFTAHTVNTGIDSLLAFPWSQGLLLDNAVGNSAFDYQPILISHVGVWTEFNEQQAELSFNSEIGELKGPMTIAYGLKHKETEQRLVIIGDSSFLSDSTINNYNNRQFSLNIISWLSSQNVVRSEIENRDNHIAMSRLTHFVFKWGFSLLFPAVLVLCFLVVRYYRIRKSSEELPN